MSRQPSVASVSSGRVLALAALMAGAAIVSYFGSFQVPFLFDDRPAIVENATIRDLSRIGEVLLPDLEGGVTTAGRPILNLSYAINYALGGYNPVGYHVANLTIHYLAALALFGIVRRTLGRFEPVHGVDRSLLTAAAVATVWMLHPLQTSAVTYLSQRAESLCGLFFLLTIYTFIRASESSSPRRWLAASVVTCALGMGTKEVMATAPVVVFLYDRTFIAGSFSVAWARRGKYYASLAATWFILVALAVGTTSRGTTAGFETVVTPWNYLLTQCDAIVHYLRLVFWPHPLVFDYGTATVGTLSSVWWQALLLTCLAGVVMWALARRPVPGFLGACFFLILAPSSSLVPIASQTIAEHRMYLPLAAVVAMVVIAAIKCMRSTRLIGALAAATVVVVGSTTAARNEIYRSGRTVWEDTVAKMPENPRAHINLALILASAGNPEAALGQLAKALEADPSSPDAHYNRGVLFSKLARKVDADSAYQAAIRFYPSHAEALNNLGALLHEKGDLSGAEDFYLRAIAARPGYGKALENLSAVLLDAGRAGEAIRYAEAAANADPRSAEAAFRLGNSLLASRRTQDALIAFRHAVDMDPDHLDARINLANLLVEMNEFEAALVHYFAVLDLRPELIPPRRNAAIILAMLGQNAGAIEQFQVLARIAPADPFYREQLAHLHKQH